jgi:hypothetical protein
VTSSLKPGTYQLQLDVNWGEPTQNATKVIQFEIVLPIGGVASSVKRLGILGLDFDRILLTGYPGKIVRQDVTLQNQIDEQLIVEARIHTPSGDDKMVSVAPSRFLLSPGGERVFQIRASIDRNAFTDVREILVILEPKRLNGEGLAEAETCQLTVVLRIQPLPSVSR